MFKSALLSFACCFIFKMSVAQQVDKNYLLGRFNPEIDNRFVRIPKQYSSGSANGQYIRKETLDAFEKMSLAAKRDGIMLTIISATRNFNSQKRIWENKWTGKTLVEGKDASLITDSIDRAKLILRFSAMPGTSRHHWGTDIDLNNNDSNEYFEQGEGLKVYQWLQKNASVFGFCQPYTSKLKTDRAGYEEEKWHWSYMPLAAGFLKQFNEVIKYTTINDFKGSSAAKSVKAIESYVAGVTCK